MDFMTESRRSFLGRVGAGSAGLFLSTSVIFGCREPEKIVPRSWLEQLLAENDLKVSSLLVRQVDDALHVNFGGIPDDFEIYHAGSAAHFVQSLTAAYVSPKSAYYHDPHLILRMQQSMNFLLKTQHDDGTIDLLTTNFHSTPDTGFVVEPLAIAYKLLDGNQRDDSAALRSDLRLFLTNAGKALTVGGVHTPNHRWVVSMALARIHELFPDARYIKRIDQWLREGIDIDGDGQFTERSTAVYSPLTDRCFITIARILDRPQLLEPVRRNLEMTLYYLHPNGEIATEASRRQDQYLARTPVAYYYPYRYMSLNDQNSTFGGMVYLLESNLGAEVLSGNLPYLLEDPLLQKEVPPGPLPDDYVRHFKDSGLVRIRRGMMGATILMLNPALFTFHYKQVVLQAVRMATAFFGKGQFVADELLVEEYRCRLVQVLEGPYYQPISEEWIAADGNWDKMPRGRRPVSEVQRIRYQLEIVEIEDGFQLDFEAGGTDNVPVAIELSFRKGGKLDGGEPVPNLPDAYFLKEEGLLYRYDDAAISIEGGLHQHAWTQLRGAEPRIDGVSVYLTGYTPFKNRVLIRKFDIT
jgi:hypothetical protein